MVIVSSPLCARRLGRAVGLRPFVKFELTPIGVFWVEPIFCAIVIPPLFKAKESPIMTNRVFFTFCKVRRHNRLRMHAVIFFKIGHILAPSVVPGVQPGGLGCYAEGRNDPDIENAKGSSL